MPHVTGHFCVCHVELWLLFHDFFPCTQCTVHLGTWVPGYLGTWVPGYLGTWVPGYLGTWVPGYLGTWVPGYLGTWVPGYLGTWVPGYLGKHVRFCSRKHVHFFAITRILFVYVLSQIEKKSIRVIAIYPFIFCCYFDESGSLCAFVKTLVCLRAMTPFEAIPLARHNLFFYFEIRTTWF